MDDNSESEDDHERIADIQLLWTDHFYQILVCESDCFSIWQDGEDPELLRKVKGGHKTEYCLAKFDLHLSLIVTAAQGGELAVWDFESS